MARGKNLTDEIRAEIVRARKTDRLTLIQIAERFGYCLATIENVVRGRNYAFHPHTPQAAPKQKDFTPPVTGSASGFIRALPYSKLVGRR